MSQTCERKSKLNPTIRKLKRKMIKIINNERIKKEFVGKVQAAFTKAVGSHQIQTITTVLNIEIRKDDRYVQKVKDELFMSQHVLSSLDTDLIKLIHVEAGKALQSIRNELSKGQETVETTYQFTEISLTAYITDLRQELDSTRPASTDPFIAQRQIRIATYTTSK